MQKREDLIREICRKCRITRRAPRSGAISKRELLLINSFLDITIERVQRDAPSASGRSGENRDTK